MYGKSLLLIFLIVHLMSTTLLTTTKEAPYLDESTLKDKMKEWAEGRRRGIGLDPHVNP